MNTLEYVPILQEFLDNLVTQNATSSWMLNNAKRVRYNGGNEVKIPTRTLTGLGDYGRTDGTTAGSYPSGSVSLSWATYKLLMDRGTQFHLDRNDDDETNFNADMTDIATQFVNTQVIPEVDAYRYSKLAATSVNDTTAVTSTVDVDNVVSLLLKDINKIGDATGSASDLIIPMAWSTYEILQNAKFNKGVINLDTGNGLNLEFNTINGIPYYPVSTARMKSAYVFSSTNGFTADASAVDINYIVVKKSLPAAINKTDKLKYFDANTNQLDDSDLLQYRLYHDLIVPENQSKQSLIANLKG